jgi:flavodoxin
MTDNDEVKVSRRRLLAVGTGAACALAVPLSGSAQALSAPAASCSVTLQPVRRSPILVAYFSRSGNTRVIAGQIQRALQAALFEIVPANPYPDDYQETVEQARRERDSRFKPPLKARVADLSAFSTIFLGFPIWGETAPPVIRSFLASHDLSAKSIVPFITHGGYGAGSSLSVIAAHAARARLFDAGLVMQADQEKQTLEHVTTWLEEVKLPSTR